jgi:tetratricopeptide (TPR) repeat protein
MPTAGGCPVSKHHKRDGHVSTLALPTLKARVERALDEDRFQHGLELARTLAKRDPSEINNELLRRACLGRARQLAGQGYHRDACTVLDSAIQLGGTPTFRAEVARELAASGDVRRALAVAEGFADAHLQPQILARAADAALVQESAGRGLLPESLRGQLDLVVRAFGQVEAGQDEQARETLQGIGLQSPFLEWKLLLRGLIAYYQGDDGRALENWQRLTLDRWPARLAAPFRFLIDKDFRAAQPAATQTALQRQADRLQGPGLAQALRGIQAALSNDRQLPSAFRQAETLLGALRREAPALVPRLAACFYWAIITHGNPEDVGRYLRVFGVPPDDPQLARLQALAMEQRGMMQPAHQEWLQLEKVLAANPAGWPGEQAGRARALVWWHMGHNADEVPDVAELPDLPPFLRDHPDRPRPLKPTAEECFEQSLKLAPDLLEAHLALLRHFQRKNKAAKAEKAARRLLKHYPEHGPTLEALGDLRMQAQDYGEGITCFEQALRANPLERRLRSKLSGAHTFSARAHAEAGRFDAARGEYQAALALDESGQTYSVLCKWAACELRAAEEERAQELLNQARGQTGSELAVAFSMLIEAIRLRLPRQIKTQFDQEVKRLLAEPPTAAAAVAVATTVAAHRAAGVTYVGQKTHEKKVLGYLEKARGLAFGEQQLLEICVAVGELDRVRLLRDYVRLGQRHFPANPFFPVTEARMNLDMGPYRCQVFDTKELLKTARGLAMALPHDERQRLLLEEIKDMEDELRQLNPFAGLFGDVPLGFDDIDEMDDDDYED